MSYYFIARIKIHDDKEYQNYLDKADDVFNKFNGKYLSVDDDPLLLEGNWDCTRSVLIQFENLDDFKAWYHSPEYQEILKHRLSAADCDTILVKGNPDFPATRVD
jgi:uncharacterized protein (DUF1330 family)